MQYYKTLDDHTIECQLCRHHCHIKEGKTAVCGIEQNLGGKLRNLTYGFIGSINVDPIEKKPLYHVLPTSKSLSLGTIGCNFRCPFCQNWQLSQGKTIKTERYHSPEAVVALAKQHNCASISYTYNEPVVFYPYARDIGMLAKKEGLKNVFVSSGYESDVTCEDMKNWVDACNIDLKSFNPEYYKTKLKADLEGVKRTLKHLVQLGIFIEITTLIIEGVNDSDEELRAMADFIVNELDKSVPWHLSAFHPDYKMMETPRTSVATLQRAYKIGREAGLEYVYLGNVRTDFATSCPQCHQPLIKRQGFTTLSNHLEDGKCLHCHTPIVGVWS
jgi:pyruvate formate lyase activating enzyme